ncbi:hypothetical protein AQUCO_01400691v1, partial [Aquilegia coerulea]
MQMEMEMERIYGKLYDKHHKSTSKTLSDYQESIREQNELHINYVSGVEAAMESLKRENERLKVLLSVQKNELTSTRTSFFECQMRLSEECQKTNALSKEVERLQNLQQERVGGFISGTSSYNLRKRKGNSDSVHSSGGTRVVSEDIATGSLRKKKCLLDAMNQLYETNQLNPSLVSGSDNNSRGDSLPEDNQGRQQV